MAATLSRERLPNRRVGGTFELKATTPADVIHDWHKLAADTWGAATAEYHRALRHRRLIVETEPEQLAQLRRLLKDSVSLDAVWHELNSRRRPDAPQPLVEALMFSLRSGVAALSRPETLRRLATLSDAQLREVAVLVQKFKPEIAQPWTPQDVEVLITVRSWVYA